MRAPFRRLTFPLMLAGCIALAFLVFWLNYRYDNKYMRAAPGAQNGIVRLDAQAFEGGGYLYLVNGWEFYQYRWLTPEQAQREIPDAHIFIGQYAGFELNEKTAPPHGEATYRLTAYIEGGEKELALELPEIYSSYHIWINGVLKRTLGRDTPKTDNSAVYFRAKDKIEIVIAVQDETHFYSGLVYPPALGTPDGINRLIQARLMLRTLSCGTALITALFLCLFGFYMRDRKGAVLQGLLCLCYIGFTAYPLVHSQGLGGLIWYDVEQACYYAMLFLIILLQAKMLALPKRVYLPCLILSALSVLLLPLYRRIGVLDAQGMFLISRLLTLYIWAACLYLLATTAHSAIRGQAYSKPLLIGFSVFALSLLFDRIYPLFEPIVGGWHNELAGFLLVMIVYGVFFKETLHMCRERLLLREENRQSRMVIEGQLEKLEKQQQYVDETSKFLHEYRSRALIAMHRIQQRELGAAIELLEQHSNYRGAYPLIAYSKNETLDILLSCFAAKAEELGVPLQLSLEGCLKALELPDGELASLTTNLLENALEANMKLPPEVRFLRFSMHRHKRLLLLRCTNPCLGQGKHSFLSSKKDRNSPHGYGLHIVRDIAKRHRGALEMSTADGVCNITVDLLLASAESMAGS